MASAKELTLYKKQKHNEKTIYKNVQDNAASVSIAALENGRCGKHIGSVVDKGGLFKKAKDCIQCLKIAGLLNQKQKKKRQKKAPKGGAIFVDDKKNPILPAPSPPVILSPVIPIPPPLPPPKIIKRKIKNKCVWCEIKKEWAQAKYDLSLSLHGEYDERYEIWINNVSSANAKYGKLLTYDCKIGPTKYFVSKNKEWDLIAHQFHEICFWEIRRCCCPSTNQKLYQCCPLNKCPVCNTNISPDELNKFFKNHTEMEAKPCTCAIV